MGNWKDFLRRLRDGFRGRRLLLLVFTLVGILLSILAPALGLEGALLCILPVVSALLAGAWGAATFIPNAAPQWRKIRVFNKADLDAVPKGPPPEVTVQRKVHSADPPPPPPPPPPQTATRPSVAKFSGVWWEDRPANNPFGTSVRALEVQFSLADPGGPIPVQYTVEIDLTAMPPPPPNEFIEEIWIVIDNAPPGSPGRYEVATVIRHSQSEAGPWTETSQTDVIP